MSQSAIVVTEGEHVVLSGKVEARGSANVVAYDFATVEAYGSAKVERRQVDDVEANAEHVSKKLPILYISGPISLGDRTKHVAAGYRWEAWAMQNGFAPINPICTTVAPFAWEDWANHDLWMQRSLTMVSVSDVMVRIPGESLGADEEVAYATAHKIPCFLPTKLFSKRVRQDLLQWKEEFQRASEAPKGLPV